YPAQESDRLPIGSYDPGYFEVNSGGLRLPGLENRVRWPGRTIWENVTFSPHYSDADMPVKDWFGDGSCDNCHNVHGSPAPHDMLDTTYAGIGGSELGWEPENYALCLKCHRIDGPPGMDDTSRSIAYYYDRSVNPGSTGGHGVSTGGGYVASGARLPCYDCHNPHGSAGYGGLGGNAYLLSDQRPGWFGLTDIRNDSVQVRRFCLGCHPSSDGGGGAGPVEGLTLPPLPSTVTAHALAATNHCYDCHGRDYSTPTSNNVHNPSPGGDCTACHASPKGLRRAVVGEFALSAHHVIAVGDSGSVTNNDCGVCHMEGSALTGEMNGSYHANGLVELRDPDNGQPLGGFVSFTRDLNSAVLEPWVVEVQNSFCLRCHDAGGALSVEARVPGGTSLTPFSDQNAVVIDVNSQFDPLNAVYHPVRAPGDNAYTVPGSVNNFTPTLLPPFNQTAAHDLISCFDCHETSGHGSGNSGMLYVETYFREPVPGTLFPDGQRQFCVRCHNEQYYVIDPTGVSRFENHDRRAHTNPGGSGRNGQSCRGCHAGIYDNDEVPTCDNGAGIGNIHGSNYTYTACAATPGQTPPAFLFGGYLKGWEQVSPTENQCYANCHHPNGKGY
ncbi:MAG: cytochrome c3 family protein, partial [Candidatus Zixiibacteriota bacterium]